VICLGDTLDRHATLDQLAKKAAEDFFITISKITPLVILIGNHDRINDRDFLSDISPFYVMKFIPNITVVDSTTWIDDEIYVPYVEPGKFLDALKIINYDPSVDGIKHPRFIFAHQEFKDSQMGSVKSIKGDIWKIEYPTVFTGHMHEYQVLPQGIICVGSLIQNKFDNHHDKALIILNFDNTEHKYVRYHLKSAPRTLILKFTQNDLDDFEDKIRNYLNDDTDLRIKVKLHLTPSESTSIKKDLRFQKLKQMVSVIDIHTDIRECSQVERIINDLTTKSGRIPKLDQVILSMLDPTEQDLFSTEILTTV